MDYKYIIYTVENGIATIKLNRPEALNALNADINNDIMHALKQACMDKDVRVLILTGSDRAFAAGADVKEMAEADPAEARDLCSLAIEINNLLESMPIPTIAAVAGFAFGGGFEMPLSCDFRIGGSRTRLAFPECTLGIIPGANGCVRASMLVGPAKAKEIVMLSDPMNPITGKEAYELGLFNWYVEGDAGLEAEAAEAKKAMKAAKKSGDEAAAAEAKKAFKAADAKASAAEYDAILAKAQEIAQRLLTRPAKALAAAKAAVNKAANDTIGNAKPAETDEFTALFATHDQKEGMAAMIEKRAPVFTNS